MIKFIKGNLFDTDCEIIAHGVNCSGGFGSGIAVQIAKLYPFAQQEYFRKFKNEGWELADVQIVDINCSNKYDRDNKINLKYIANVATQEDFGGSKIHADYDAIKQGLHKVFIFAEIISCRVAMPKIGCGLANGDWTRVEKIIKKLVKEFKVETEVYYL